MRNKKVRILFVIHSLKGGGAERVMSLLLNSLSRELFDISLITFSSEKDYDLPSDTKIFCFKKNKVSDWISIVLRLIKFLRAEKYDLIVSFLTHVNIIVITAWLLSGRKCPLIISERTNPLEHFKYSRLTLVKKKLLKILYPLANFVVCVSYGVKEVLAINFKIPSGKIRVIYNPIDIKRIDALKEEKVNHPWFNDNAMSIIITCGRLTPAKNYPLLIKAFKSLIDKGFSARLVILGEGEEKEKLKRLIIKLNLKSHIVFLGFQKNPYKYISRATIFVLSSKYEGFPNVLLEAMACGVPVISTDCPYGPSEIIEHGRNGFLVPVDDEEKLAEAMEKLLRDLTLRVQISFEGRKLVEERFGLEKIIKEWQDVILEGVSTYEKPRSYIRSWQQ